MLILPPGQGFSLYSLAALLPLLPAKQRVTHPNDWMTTDSELAILIPTVPGASVTRSGIRTSDEYGERARLRLLLSVLNRIATKHSSDIAIVATHAILDRPTAAAAIVGATNTSHLASHGKIGEVHLDFEDQALIAGVVAGTAPGGQTQADHETQPCECKMKPSASLLKWRLHLNLRCWG